MNIELDEVVVLDVSDEALELAAAGQLLLSFPKGPLTALGTGPCSWAG